MSVCTHTPRTPPPVSRALSGRCSATWVSDRGTDSSLCTRCPLAVWGQHLASKAVLGMEGVWGLGVMLEAGASRCLLTVVPLHVPVKGDLHKMCIRCVKNLETAWFYMVGGRAEGRSWWFPSIFSLLLWWTWQLLQRTAIAWLRHESNVEHSLQQPQGCTGSWVLCSGKPRGIRSQQEQ